ncbi:MAG: AraC family transcriptional regulator [Clostridia bacterium]|nr:AraC family transcriptional regulator [Clostridia bacterium]
MYISAWGEEIVIENTLGSDYLEVIMAGITHPNPTYRIMHNISDEFPYDYYVFEYVVSGTGYIETPAKKYMVRGGDFYFLNRQRYHIYYADPKDPYEKLFIVLKGSFVDFLVSHHLQNDSVYIKKCNVHGLMVHMINLLNRDGPINYDKLAVSILELFQQAFPSPYQIQPAINRVPEMIKNYIDTHITEKITLDDISNDLYISKSYIERVFKNEYNQTPMAYCINQKISQVASMLVTTNYSLSHIAQQFSFSDVKYMSKTFKKIKGKTPMEYKRDELAKNQIVE